MAVSNWRIEVYAFGKWSTHTLCPRGYGEGYLDHHRDAHGPRCAMRLVDPAGRVRDEVKAVDTVSIGMIAGWPTAEQYEAAANVALERARLIRERRELELEREAERKRERWS